MVMSLARNLYHEITGQYDRDAYAPSLYAFLIALAFLIPWARILRVLGFMILIWVVVVLILI
jgi:hypothetical protein